MKKLGAMFYLGLLIKICIVAIISENILTTLFIPFVDFFVESGFQNPYKEFLNIGNIAHFPYPALMLYIFSIPKILFGAFLLKSPFWSFFLYIIPILCADILIFSILRYWLDAKYHNKIIWFYWLSPVLIYINYIHGQIDVIPIALLFLSLCFLFKNRLNSAALLLGLSLASKTNIFLIYPFFFLFLITQHRSYKRFFTFLALSLSIFTIGNLPFLFDTSYIAMVFDNAEQGKLFDSFIQLNNNLTLYLIPSALLILFVRGVLLKQYNKNIFIMFIGFSFSIILLFIPPMPGWYFWLLPFLAYFYIKEEGRSSLLFFGLQFFYLLYFFCVTQFYMINTIFINLNKEIFINIAFTALQTTLFINCIWIYRKGIDSYSKHKITSSPFLIGIGGNSGAGKTTISDAISMIFTPHNTTILRGDDMHKWQRGHEKWLELTHLDPKANFLHKEIDFLKRLKSGKKIYRRHYDHSVGTFTKDYSLSPNSLVIFEGLHPFYLQAQRTLYDLKVFIDPDPNLAMHWKFVRDIEKRGHTKKQILASIQKRTKDFKKYIESQMPYADIVISPMPLNPIKNIGEKAEEVDIYYKMLLSNIVYIEPIIEGLQEIKTLNIVHDYTENDQQSVSIKGTCSLDDVNTIVNKFIPSLEDLGVYNSTWPQNSLGALLLILTYYIIEKAENEKQ